MRLMFKSADLEESRSPSGLWWASSNQLTVRLEHTLTSPGARGNSASRQPLCSNSRSSLSLPALPFTFLDSPSLHNHESQFLKIDLSLSLSLNMYTPPVGSVSLENPN